MKAAKKAESNKVVLAYSGGLDTSVILKWLQDTYHCEVVTFTADLGQGEELEPARTKALKMGIKPKNIFIDDLREEFVRDFVFPMFRCNTVYEGEYLLGTSIARPLIAKRLVEIARKTGANSISHGATGKGNDQVRFELGAYALMPNVRVIAPWREWDLLSREKLMAYAEKNGIPVEMKHKKGGSPYSMDANLLHISYEGRHLEDPSAEAEESMWRWTVSPEKAPNQAEYLDIEYRKRRSGGLERQQDEAPRAARGAQPARRQARHRAAGPGREPLRRHEVARLLRNPGRHHHAPRPSRHRVDLPRPRSGPPQGRPDAALCVTDLQRLLVEPGAQGAAGPDRPHPADRQRLGPAQAVQGQRDRVGRDSKTDSLFDPTIATFEDDAGAYNQKDAHGFIRLNALRMRIAANRAEGRGGKKKG
jgi:argininosuccinate synthase